MIEISSTAKDKLREHLEKDPSKSPRIAFAEGGISGPQLKFFFEEPQAGDISEETEDFKILIAEDVTYFTRNMVIDYVGQEDKGQFNITSRDDIACDGDCNRCSGCEPS